jgi:hypothetical protein
VAVSRGAVVLTGSYAGGSGVAERYVLDPAGRTSAGVARRVGLKQRNLVVVAILDARQHRLRRVDVDVGDVAVEVGDV